MMSTITRGTMIQAASTQPEYVTGRGQSQGHQGVLAGAWVVGETQQAQRPRHRRANFSRGGVLQAKAQLACWEFNAIEIAGDGAIRREYHDGAVVRELVALGVVGVPV